MPVAFISAGSTTRVKDGPGLFKGAWIAPAAGSSIVIADNPDLGTTGPNFNSAASVTSTIALPGVYPASPVPVYFDAHALRFANALTVAATSSARVTLFYE